MIKLSKDIERDVIREYNNGKSCKAVGDALRISNTSVFNILKRNNVSLRTKGGIFPLPNEEIIREYKEGQSSLQIAEKYGVTCSTILNHLKENRIDIDNKYYNLSLNHEYFDNIDSYDKAYFLGFMTTDGYVSKTGNTVSLCLKSSDDSILRRFSDKIGSENNLYYSRRGEARMSFKSAKIKRGLSAHGVTPDKNTRISFPLLSDELMPHYIRGIIDGDGWISAKSRQVGFCGNEKIVTRLRDYFSQTLGTYPVKILHPSKNLWQITWGSRRDIEAIGQYMYADKKDCFLFRKYENFMLIPR